jgi:hypothetical protein
MHLLYVVLNSVYVVSHFCTRQSYCLLYIYPLHPTCDRWLRLSQYRALSLFGTAEPHSNKTKEQQSMAL